MCLLSVSTEAEGLVYSPGPMLSSRAALPWPGLWMLGWETEQTGIVGLVKKQCLIQMIPNPPLLLCYQP